MHQSFRGVGFSLLKSGLIKAKIIMKYLPLVRDAISPSCRARGWRQSFWENGQSNTLVGRRRSRRKALRHLKWSVKKEKWYQISCLIGNAGLSLVPSPESLDGRGHDTTNRRTLV